MVKNTVIVDERPVLQGLLWSSAPTRPAPARAPTGAVAPGFDLVLADLDAASTGGRAAASLVGLSQPHDHRPYTPERIQEVIGPFLK